MELSVVVPCYNSNKYIKELIECFLRQTFSDWEAIIVDDGSTDNTLDILHEFAKADDRIKVVERNRNPKGGDTCRNIGMELASGEYLIIFDSDDIITDNCFEKRVNFMEQNPGCDYASFPAKTFIDYGDGVYKYQKKISYGISKGRKSLLEYLLLADYPFTVWGNIYRRDKLSGITWDEKIAVYQDFDFMFSGIMSGLKHCYSDRKDPDYFYRLYALGGSTSSSYISEAKLSSTLYLYTKVLDRIKAREDYENLKKCLLSFIYWHLGRIVAADNEAAANKLMEVISIYYSHDTLKRMYTICKKCFDIKNENIRKTMFDFNVSLYLGYSRNINMLAHDLLKILLLR